MTMMELWAVIVAVPKATSVMSVVATVEDMFLKMSCPS